MGLPDISRLIACDRDLLRAFGVRLKTLGLDPATARPFIGLAASVPPPLRRPARTFHLSLRRDPTATALRMFFFNDPVDEGDARAACGPLFDRLVDVGLIAPASEGKVVSPFALGIVNDLYVLSDDLSAGEGAAMGFGDSTIALCRAALPDQKIGRALDIGCGSGTAALVLARRATLAIGTDINPRAVELSRVNAAINGIENVEFRVGDLFEPVAGETFDLIVSQPPFIPMPDGAAPSTFQFGGRRGDELVLKMLPRVPAHLAPGGRAVLLIEWPVDGTSLAERVDAAVASSSTDVLVLHCPETDADEHATGYAALSHPDLGDAFQVEARDRRAHFHRTEVSAMKPTLTILEPTTETPFVHLVAIDALPRVTVLSERINRLVRAKRIANTPERLLAATARFPRETTVIEERSASDATAPPKVFLQFSRTALVPRLGLSPDQYALYAAVHASPDVRTGIERFASERGMPADAIDRLLPALKAAVSAGLMEIPPA